MAKKCISCGAELEDDVMFCDKCGAKQEVVTQNVAAAVPEKESDNIMAGLPKNIIIALVAAAVIIVLAIVAIASLAGGGYKKAIKAEVNAFNKQDVQKFIKTYPKDLLDALDDKADKRDDADFEEEMEDVIDVATESYEDDDDIGSNPKVKVAIIDKIKLTEDDIKEVKKKIKDEEVGLDYKADIKKGYSVLVKYTIKGDDGEDEYFESCTVCKVDGKWVVVSGGFVSGGYITHFNK